MTSLSTSLSADSKRKAGGTLKWRLLLVLVICIIPLLFAQVGPDYYSGRLYRALWDLGHIPFFTLASYVVVRVLRTRINLSGLSWVLILLGGALLLGSLVEFIQMFVGRSVSMRDVFSDFVGAYIVCALYSPLHRQSSALFKWFLRGSLAILLGFALVPLAAESYDHVLAHRQFPVLAGFEQPTETTRWKGEVDYERVRFNAAAQSYALRVRFDGQGYEWLSLWHFPRDWRDYDWLRFSVFNDGEAFDINLRIHDEPYVRSEMVYSDRYNQRLTLEAGWNHFAVPLEEIERGPATRLMDMSQVWAVWFFVHDLGREASLYLDDIRLEKH